MSDMKRSRRDFVLLTAKKLLVRADHFRDSQLAPCEKHNTPAWYIIMSTDKHLKGNWLRIMIKKVALQLYCACFHLQSYSISFRADNGAQR